MRKKFLPHVKLLLISLIVVFAFTGCATKQVKMTETGFLSSYDDLQADMDSQGMYIYTNPDVKISERYSKILIAPVQFRLDPTLKQHALSDEDREKLADHFIKELEEALAESYEIADAPGTDVLLFRTAITDILPNKVYLNLHWTTTLMGGGIGGASLEAELVDSITGERVASFVDARKGKKLTQKLTVPNYAKGLTKWGHTKGVLKVWANLMVENLNRVDDQYWAGSL